MSVGKIEARILWDDYFESLHGAYNSLKDMFARRGISQDELAERVGSDKSLISRRLRGTENLTLKTLSFMASALGCRLSIKYVPYEEIGAANYFEPAGEDGTATPSNNNLTGVVKRVPPWPQPSEAGLSG